MDSNNDRLDPSEFETISKIEKMRGYIYLQKDIESIHWIKVEDGHIVSCEITFRIGQPSMIIQGKPLSAYPEILDSILKFSKLKRLFLYKQSINYFPEPICRLSCLEELDLTNNNISSIPENIENLKSLRSLIIRENMLKNLPPALERLENLRHLDLSRNQFDALPPVIIKLAKLTSLWINNNPIAPLPEWIGNLEKLEFLLCNSSEITLLPQSIGNLHALKELHLDKNFLISLPETIGNLSSLQTLSIRNNKIESLPVSIGKVSSLQKLNLQNNKLKLLPESIGSLSSLQTLNIESNQLESLPESIGDLISLKTLNVWQNPMRNLTPKVIDALERLKKHGCQIFSNTIRNMKDKPHNVNVPITEYRINDEFGDYYYAVFPFFGQFQLVAQVEKDRGTQELTIEYLDSEGSVADGIRIGCVHTVVTTTVLEELEQIPPEISKEDYFLNGVSTQHLPEIFLTPEEHFFALKSWVQAIAETGEEFVANLESAFPNPNVYRFFKVFFKLIAKYDTRFIERYLSRVEKECQVDGKPHIPSLIASLKVFDDLDPQKAPEIIKMLLSMNLPLEVYANILSYKVMKSNFEQDPLYEEVMFKYQCIGLAGDPEAVKYAKFGELFENRDFGIRYKLISNPAAVELPGYKLLFTYEDLHRALLFSDIARRHPEYSERYPNYKALRRQHRGWESEEDEDDEDDEDDDRFDDNDTKNY